MKLDAELLTSVAVDRSSAGELGATISAHGLYNAFQFVLRLSPAVHRALGDQPFGVVTSGHISFERVQAFSTYLHETVHWWQHIGSTYGLMRSLSYPSQAHANYTHLKRLLQKTGFKKSVRKLAASLSDGASTPETPSGLANIIVNNHFDLGAYRNLTYNRTEAMMTAEDPMFESVGHAYEMTYANNVLALAAVADREFRVFQHPKEWEAPFRALRKSRQQGFYYGSPVEVWPVGAHEILEGQACFIQLQYLAFASGGRLGWQDFRDLGMLHGVYEQAFVSFLKDTGLPWPPAVDHPTVGLFLLICDMAINPGAGFPHALNWEFRSFISDVDPGVRFTTLSTMVRLKLPSVADAIREYSRQEYEQVTKDLTKVLLIDSPLEIASTCSKWAQDNGALASLMQEYKTFNYQPINLPVRVLFSHFLAFMRDKLHRPEFFCWPGAWMAGARVDEHAATLFERHQALFVDKEEGYGIFPRQHTDRDELVVHNVFEAFYAVNITYDMTNQWISHPGPFTYKYRWLADHGSHDEIKSFADRHFVSVYGAHPDNAELL